MILLLFSSLLVSSQSSFDWVRPVLDTSNLFVPQYLFTHTNETITIISASVWVNITFGQEATDLQQGIIHNHSASNNHLFTVETSGLYDVEYKLAVQDTSASASDIDVAARAVFLNGSEILGSVFETDIIKQGVDAELSHSFLVRLEAGETFYLQFTATDNDIELSTHGTFGDHPDSVTIDVQKIANV